MSASNDDTILPPSRKPSPSTGLDGETVLPSNNTTGIHNPSDVIDNRYKVIREIGRGGMGVVYEVEDELADIRVAVKRLLPELANRSDLLEVFKREGKNAMRFTAESPRFVTMRHLGNDAHGLYLVMDFVEDVTLRTYLQSQPDHRLSVSSATAIMYELATALSDLHRLGFVHRDLKPENIFVRVDADGVRIRLVDFGLTKDDVEGTRTSMRGAGTSGYASPEQRKGLPTTAATDIYAFGVIAYEMLTGELPGIGDAIADFVDNVPTSLDEAIMQCLSTRPERRFTSGVALLAAISAKSDQATQSAKVESAPKEEAPPPVAQVGTLVLTGVPSGAEIFLDGRSVNGMFHQLELTGSSTQVELLVKCSGFIDYSRQVLLVGSTITDEHVHMELQPVKPRHRLAEFPTLGRYVHTMCQIPAGTFQMGSNGLSDDEKPVHSVSLSSFYLGATPVTVAMWKEYCSATNTEMPKAPSWGWLDDHPVVHVSWDDIMGVDGTGGFCAWVSEIAGGRLTLPTEAQWEYAARGGVGGQEFPWGNIFETNRLWCSGKDEDDVGKTAPVNRSTRIFRNPYGLTDMAGNVWEWCSDLYDAYSSESQTNPTGPSSTSDNVRCVRGGSWLDYNPDLFRCANRDRDYPKLGYNGLGFRLSAGPG
jgi:sulfatase modifying factor 1